MYYWPRWPVSALPRAMVSLKTKKNPYRYIQYIVMITAQTTCKNGLGRVLYERLPNQQLQGYDDDVVRDTAPPFRVLEKCQDLCLRDRTGTNNLVRTCTSFDFQPGSRITSFGGTSEYEESLCYLTSEQAGPEGIGSLMLVPNSVHFNEICLTCECVGVDSTSGTSRISRILRFQLYLCCFLNCS